MASSKSEIELSPVPTKDEVDGKPDEENAVDDVIQSQLARIKHFQSIVAQALFGSVLLSFVVSHSALFSS